MFKYSSAPLSPHLQRYKLPLNAWLSITHRLTGVVLFAGFVVLPILLVIITQGEQAWLNLLPWISHWVLKCLLFMFTFSLYFHMCHGIRHLFWDVGKGHEIDTVTMTAKLAIMAAFFLNLLTWLLVWL